MSESKYANEILHHAHVTDNKIVDSPIGLLVEFSTLEGVPLDDPTEYPELVGSLAYLIVTQQDISYVVYIVSQFVCLCFSYSFGCFVPYFVVCSGCYIFIVYSYLPLRV